MAISFHKVLFRVVGSYRFDREVGRVQESIKEGLGKEYRRNPEITIGAALSEVWADLDVALLGADPEHASRRVMVMNAAIDRLRLQGRSEEKVRRYLPPQYLCKAI